MGIEIPFPQRMVPKACRGMVCRRRSSSSGSLHSWLWLVSCHAGCEADRSLARGAQWESYLSGERVVRQGEPGEALYVIVSGQADGRVDQGRFSSVIATLGGGQFFGEMSLLTGEPKSATVMAAAELLMHCRGESRLNAGRAGRSAADRMNRRDRGPSTNGNGRYKVPALSGDAAALSAITHTRSLVERIQKFFLG